jgi:hypothetical protein
MATSMVRAAIITKWKNPAGVRTIDVRTLQFLHQSALAVRGRRHC